MLNYILENIKEKKHNIITIVSDNVESIKLLINKIDKINQYNIIDLINIQYVNGLDKIKYDILKNENNLVLIPLNVSIDIASYLMRNSCVILMLDDYILEILKNRYGKQNIKDDIRKYMINYKIKKIYDRINN